MGWQPLLDRRRLVGGGVVEDQVNLQVVGYLVVEPVEELLALDRAVAGVQRTDHLARRDVQCRIQAGGAEPFVVVTGSLRRARQHRKRWRGAVERLDLRLDIDAQNDRSLWRMRARAQPHRAPCPGTGGHAAGATDRDGEAPSILSGGGSRPHQRSTAAPTGCAVWPRRSAAARQQAARGGCDAAGWNGQPSTPASDAAARSPAATVTTIDARWPATRQTAPPPPASTRPPRPRPPTPADQQVRASHYRAHSSEPPWLSRGRNSLPGGSDGTSTVHNVRRHVN